MSRLRMWLRGREVGRFEPLSPLEPEPQPDLGTLGSASFDTRPLLGKSPLEPLKRHIPPADFEGTAADHKFQAPEGQPWGLCTLCGFGQASHLESDPYVSDAPRAPKGAVRTGTVMHTSDITRPQLAADIGVADEEES